MKQSLIVHAGPAALCDLHKTCQERLAKRFKVHFVNNLPPRTPSCGTTRPSFTFDVTRTTTRRRARPDPTCTTNANSGPLRLTSTDTNDRHVALDPD